MNDIEKKQASEKKLVTEMIRIYCHGQHHPKEDLCPECADLASYAKGRIDCCPFIATKTFCSSCKVHCYRPEMKEKIRMIMRYAGPRVFFFHPVLCVHYGLDTATQKKNKENIKMKSKYHTIKFISLRTGIPAIRFNTKKTKASSHNSITETRNKGIKIFSKLVIAN